MPPTAIKWTDEMDAYLRKHWGRVPLEEIARAFKCSKQAVRRRGQRLNLGSLVPGKVTMWDMADDDELRTLWVSVKLIDLAEYFGVSVGAVRHAARRLGLQSRHPSDDMRPLVPHKRVQVAPASDMEPDLPMTFAPVASRRFDERGQGNLLQSEAEWKRKAREANEAFEGAYRWAAATNGWNVREYRA